MSRTLLRAAFAACLFFLIVGGKWATFDRFGSPMPDWDQWDAEAMELFIPWFENDQFLTHLFNPHNEHRVVLTKLQNLTLGLLNGQWDSRLEAATNALLHAGVAVAFWLAGCGWIARRWHAPFFVITAVLFGFPVAWQNVLGGFHSQQYWLLGLSLAAIVLLPFARPWTRRWWCGTAAATLALGSMGSGFLAAAVVLMVIGWRLLRRDAAFREIRPTLAAMAGLVALGALTRVDVPWHADLKAKTVHDFVFSIVHSLEWPHRERHWAAAILWAPWVLVAWAVAQGRRAPPDRADHAPAPAAGRIATPLDAAQAILALGGWVLIQLAATAYARGVGADYPASRYMDTLVFGAMANAAALGWLLTPEASAPAGRSRAARGVGYVLAAAWLLTLGAGLKKQVGDTIGIELPDARKYYRNAEGHMRRFLATGDPTHFSHSDVPFPSTEGLIDRLGNPSLRALMPEPVRTPLAVTPAGHSPAFAENDARGAHPDFPPRAGLSPATPPLDYTKTWGSYGTPAGPAATGEWRSLPLQPRVRGWLKFETAGQPGEPGVSLTLVDAHSGARLADVVPSRIPGDSWRAVYVPAPRQPFVMVARDTDPTRWLAFSGPVEVGTLSFWAARATKHGLLVLAFAAGATLLLGVLALATRRSAGTRASGGPG